MRCKLEAWPILTSKRADPSLLRNFVHSGSIEIRQVEFPSEDSTIVPEVSAASVTGHWTKPCRPVVAPQSPDQNR